jgi:hypothetical protein
MFARFAFGALRDVLVHLRIRAPNSLAMLPHTSSADPEPSRPSFCKEARRISRLRVLLPLVILISLVTGTAQAQHAPIIFYNVPNWTPDYLNVRYATPLEAFAIPWDSNVWKCLDGQPGYEFVGIFPIQVSGYPDGSFYNASYYHKNEFTCTVDSGPYTLGSAARRYAHCPLIDV